MASKLLRSRIGSARLSGDTDPTQASYTQDIRAQMDGIEKALSSVIAQVQAAGPQIILEALQPTFDKSQAYCPKDTYALANSGYLEAREVGDKTVVEIGYGKGGNPNYAVYVHERTDLRHKAPTRAKFLQAALEEDMDEIKQRIAIGYRNLIS